MPPRLDDVVLTRDNLYLCGDPGQNQITKDITAYKLNRVVIAACSVRMHEPTFRNCVARAGLNPFLMEMTNIREQDTWVHAHDPEGALIKAKDLVAAAVAKVRHVHPLQPIEVPVTKTAMVIGGGVAGISAALDLARYGHQDLPGGEGAEHRRNDGAAQQNVSHHGLFVFEFSPPKWLTRRVIPRSRSWPTPKWSAWTATSATFARRSPRRPAM